jgi:hypothetical protein
MFVSGACCVLSGRVLYGRLITRPKQSYRMWCVLRVFSAIHLHPTLTSALCRGELHDTSPVPQEKFLLYLLNRRVCTALSYIEDINFSPLPGIETRLQGCREFSLITILTYLLAYLLTYSVEQSPWETTYFNDYNIPAYLLHTKHNQISHVNTYFIGICVVRYISLHIFVGWYISLYICVVWYISLHIYVGRYINLHICVGRYISLHIYVGRNINLHICVGRYISLHVCVVRYINLHICVGQYISLHICVGRYISLHICVGWYISLHICVGRYMRLHICVLRYISLYICVVR